MHKLLPFAVLLLAGCTGTNTPAPVADNRESIEVCLPTGLAIVEQQPDGYFIRLSSPSRVSTGQINAAIEALEGSFDRIDFCTDAAHERGDEYLSVIEGCVYDYENDIIYSLK